MVNNDPRKLVYGACATKVSKKGRTHITNGPIYDLSIVQQLVKANGFRVITEDAELDKKIEFSPELTDDELIDFICALQSSDYENSERCKTSVGRTTDCDSYAMHWNRSRKCRWSHGFKIYVKFGFFENNQMCVVVSIHPALY